MFLEFEFQKHRRHSKKSTNKLENNNYNDDDEIIDSTIDFITKNEKYVP